MGRWTQRLKERNDEIVAGLTPEKILNKELSELTRLGIELQIFSEVLGCDVYFCINEIANQIKKYDPDAIAYTTNELSKLCVLKPNPHELKRIHDAKLVFPGSTISNTINRETLISETFENLNQYYLPGLYDYLKIHDKEIYEKLQKIERMIEISYLIKSTSVLNRKLKEYRDLMVRAIKEFKLSQGSFSHTK